MLIYLETVINAWKVKNVSFKLTSRAVFIQKLMEKIKPSNFYKT